MKPFNLSQHLRRSALNASDAPFNAKGDNATDNAVAIAAAVEQARAAGVALIFAPGIYRSSAPFDFGVLSEVRGIGEVTLKYTGNGNYCVGVIAPVNTISYGHIIDNFTIEGSGDPNQDGLRVERHTHGQRSNLRVKNVSRDAFAVLGDVCSTYLNCICSGNEEAFTTAPRSGLLLDSAPYNAGVTATTDCTFINQIAERCRDYGWFLRNTSGNTFLGGTAEAIRVPGGAGIGMFLEATATKNLFINTFGEANLVADIDCTGKDNIWIGGSFYSAGLDPNPQTVTSVVFRNGATGNGLRNVRIWQLTFDAGADNCAVVGCYIGRAFTNNAAATFIQDIENPFASVGRYPSIQLGNKADPNPKAFDWYEEGAFVPVVAGGTAAGAAGAYVNQIGTFTRIGNVVKYFVKVNYNGHTGTGSLTITGLPYPVKAGAMQYPTTDIVASNLTYPGDLSAWAESGTSRIVMISQSTGAALAALAMDAAADINISGEYVCA